MKQLTLKTDSDGRIRIYDHNNTEITDATGLMIDIDLVTGEAYASVTFPADVVSDDVRAIDVSDAG